MNLNHLLLLLTIGTSLCAMDDASKIPGGATQTRQSVGYYDGYLGQNSQHLYGFVGYRYYIGTHTAPMPTPAPTPVSSDEETNVVYY